MENFKRDFCAGFRAGQRRVKPRGFKFWLNVVTILLIVIILAAAHKDIASAFCEVTHANWLVLSLLLPIQFASYYAGTEIFLTYLRARGQLRNVNSLEATSMSLELNFVNHVFPSGGVSGIGYMSWRLGKLGVSAGQATMAQIMKYVVQVMVFMVLMVLALLWSASGNQMPDWIVMAATIVIVSLVFILIFGSYLIGSRERMISFAHFLTNAVNRFVSFATRHRKKNVAKSAIVEKFFLDFNEDFLALKSDKKLLLKPIIWAFVFTICDVGLFVITFASLGVFVNPAILFIAYGAATLSGMFMITPGGAGAYEAIMIGILTAGGVAASTAFAGVILARVILILLTLGCGVVVYQRALRKYGRPANFERTAEQSLEKVANEEKCVLDEPHFAPKSPELPQKISRISMDNLAGSRYQKIPAVNRERANSLAQPDKSALKVDREFANQQQNRRSQKLKLSSAEADKFARQNIADITIDGDDDDA